MLSVSIQHKSLVYLLDLLCQQGPLTAQHFAEDVAVMLQGFFDGLTRRVAQVDSRLIELVEATQTAMDEYDVILKTIVDSGRLDEHFVR